MKRLIVITGPTASGKSDLSLELAKRLNTSIISADSRQMYRDISIGTAAPTLEERAVVPYYFIGNLSLEDYYSAYKFETESLEIINDIFKTSDYCIVCGGSMLYIDALTRGLDDIPTISPGIREKFAIMYTEKGLNYLLEILKEKDPEYYRIVDKNNHKRVIHALEIIYESNQKYSALRTSKQKKRPFQVYEFALQYSREQLFNRINDRVDKMLEHGLIDEARKVYPMRGYNSLNTVGYKELFAAFDGLMTIEDAVEKIKKNTRIYAKKQLTWLKKRNTILLDSSLPANKLCENILNVIS